ASDLSAARQAFERGDLDTAIDVAQPLYAANPNRIDVLLVLVRALIYRSYSDYDTARDRQTALSLTAAAITQRPNDPEVLALHAFALHADGQSVAAFKTAEQALRTAPEHILARIVYGMAYGGAGALDNALREHQQTLATLDPGIWRLELLRALAIAYSDVGRYREAGELVEQALALNPHLPVLHYERALYALQLGDSNTATEAYFEVLAQSPDSVKARLRLCELSSMLRERETALGYCNEVVERAPTWAEGWHMLGREYFLEGDFPAAQNAFNRCSSLQIMQAVPVAERTFECWYLQGQAAEINGDCPALLATYNEFRAMSAAYPIPQTWAYPPEGPALCVQS
ncbi:MAG: tetratricopeptide repeat protein, partial [Armatimonadetes bacterium]|nr:tetratricopeptide repeat protein [Anaerolineae bacterium]